MAVTGYEQDLTQFDPRMIVGARKLNALCKVATALGNSIKSIAGILNRQTDSSGM